MCFEKAYPVNSSTTINGEFFVRCHENGHKWVTLSTEYPNGGFDIDKQFGWSGKGNYRMKTMYYYLSETDKRVLNMTLAIHFKKNNEIPGTSCP